MIWGFSKPAVEVGLFSRPLMTATMPSTPVEMIATRSPQQIGFQALFFFQKPLTFFYNQKLCAHLYYL